MDRFFIRRYIRFYLASITLTLLFLILAVLAKLNPYFGIDLQITKSIQGLNFVGFDSLMRFLSYIGEAKYIVAVAGGTSLALFLFRRKVESLLLVVSIVLSLGTGFTFKHLVERSRPDPNLIKQYQVFGSNDSFPSGHVLLFIALFGFLAAVFYINMRAGWRRLLIVLGLLTLIFLIGVSRIYLGAHWFSDVLGSYLLGFALLNFNLILYKVSRP